MREQQHLKEANRLRTAMEMLLDEAGKRTAQEVAAVRKECSVNIDKMAEEIEKLETVSYGL